DHDAKILNTLSNCGSSRGTFQYASDVAKLSKCVVSVLDVLTENIVQYKIHLHASTISAATTSQILKFQISQNDIDKGQIAITSKGTNLVYSLSKADDRDPLVIENSLWLLRSLLETESENIFVANPSKERMAECLVKIGILSEKIQEIVKISFKLPKSLRPALMEKCMELTALIDALRARAAIAAVGKLTNEQIAEWKDLASRPRLTNRRANKELDKRTLANVDILNDSAKQIQNVVDRLDFDNLVFPADIMENCTCIFTLNTPKEAMQEGDCMCLTLQVRRSEATIFDPNQLTIENIGLTWMTCDTFFETSAIAKRYANSDSIKYDAPLKPNTLAEAVPSPQPSKSDFQGGFDKKNSSSLVKGVAAEDINAIMPLYLSKDHWEIAKLKMKPVLGYVCTLDVTGFTASQTLIVPFLVLYKSIADSKNHDDNRTRFIRRLVEETCDAVYETRPTFRQDTVKRYHDYLASPIYRHTEVVPRTSTFLMHLYTALRAGDITIDDFRGSVSLLASAVLEETIRRYFRDIEAIPSNLELYNIDKAKMVTNVVDEWEKATMASDSSSESNAALMFRLARSSASIQKVQDENTPEAVTTTTTTSSDKNAKNSSAAPPMEIKAPVFNASKFTISAATESFIQKTTQHTSHSLDQLFYALKHIANLSTTPDPLTTMKPINRLCMIIQCHEQRKHADRLAAIESGIYVDFTSPTTPSKATKAFIETRWTRTIQSERQREINNVMLTRSAGDAFKSSNQFAKSIDVDECAGLVMTVAKSIGGPAFASFLGIFQTTKYVHAAVRGDDALKVEKLRLFVLGEHDGVILRVDRHHGRLRWKPSRKNMFRIWVAYRRIMTREMFVDLFPDNVLHIDSLYNASKYYIYEDPM
ncbi:hypothetical protein HK096_010760, partial [Nowakowskiella sp. JEL0078]